MYQEPVQNKHCKILSTAKVVLKTKCESISIKFRCKSFPKKCFHSLELNISKNSRKHFKRSPPPHTYLIGINSDKTIDTIILHLLATFCQVQLPFDSHAIPNSSFSPQCTSPRTVFGQQ